MRQDVIVGYYVYLDGMFRPIYATPDAVLNYVRRRRGFFSNVELQGESRSWINADTLIVIEDRRLMWHQVIVVKGKSEKFTIKALDLLKYKLANAVLCEKGANDGVKRDGGHCFLRKKREWQ